MTRRDEQVQPATAMVMVDLTWPRPLRVRPVVASLRGQHGVCPVEVVVVEQIRVVLRRELNRRSGELEQNATGDLKTRRGQAAKAANKDA